ncbi:NAD+ synthetase [Cyanobium sp. Copco_Reservoir_LC18]|uniref:NAD+ synthase n=1 Tax=Cyanobium sp. Copco_Reservoir_LC18 TaxID=1328305 RepID=UPI001359B82E|nr:NAD+ synthase [Cyanobium sp. Copco_Reservoir_LC18]KAF0654385.1 NAD+ synthetase [Cyanobium sp. Copco_Reservoir_LC18]
MRLALAQLNPLVGDLEGNGRRILAAAERARAGGADLLLTPELSLWGYPPRDLLLRPALIQRQEGVLETLAAACPGGLALLVGVAEPLAGRRQPGLHNALALVERDRWRIVCRKRLLPSYDVFDERRYFLPGDAPAVLELEAGGRPWRLGLTICEDLWVEENLRSRWPDAVDPIADLAPQRIDLLLNLSASPFGRGKGEVRQGLAARAAARLGAPVVYLNQVGGNDELVFDGASFVVDRAGRSLLRLACAAEDLGLWDAGPPPAADGPTPPGSAPAAPPPPPDPWEQLLRVLVLGVRDYAAKCGFQRALLGLSGGIDSALVAVIAAAALGPDRVEVLRMPSPFSSAGSLDDADGLARRLGLASATLPIAPLMETFAAALPPALGAPPAGVTAENLQSRIRGTLLMAVANQKGGLLLSTGNKSELAVGYCTLYGDMNGGLSVIGDLYKTTVFGLCEWLDGDAAGPCRASLGLPTAGELIGAAIRTKPPSAELRPDQRDSDSLPDYGVLDPLLKASIEELRTPEQLVAEGADPALVARVAGLLRRAEFKRRQAAPVLKVSDRAFGSGWRMPIASA